MKISRLLLGIAIAVGNVAPASAQDDSPLVSVTPVEDARHLQPLNDVFEIKTIAFDYELREPAKTVTLVTYAYRDGKRAGEPIASAGFSTSTDEGFQSGSFVVYIVDHDHVSLGDTVPGTLQIIISGTLRPDSSMTKSAQVTSKDTFNCDTTFGAGVFKKHDSRGTEDGAEEVPVFYILGNPLDDTSENTLHGSNTANDIVERNKGRHVAVGVLRIETMER